MMKKAGAGILWFGMGAFVLFGGAAFAQEALEAPAAAASEPAPAATAASAASPSFAEANAQAAARMESLQELELDELKGMLKQLNDSLPALGKKSSELSAELREARNKADREAEEVRALYKQIAEIQAQIAAVTDTLPGVREKLEAYNAAQATMFGEMQFRTKLMGLIRQKEQTGAATVSAEKTP